MKKRSVETKQVPIQHKDNDVMKKILLMSVGTAAVLLFRKMTNPKNNFTVKRIN